MGSNTFEVAVSKNVPQGNFSVFIYPKLVCESFNDNFEKKQLPKTTWPYFD
jgi:hypothetical protein